MSWRVLGVATVSLWGIFLLARGNLELANAPTNLPAMQETWVQSLGWKHTLEKEMAMHSSTPAWRISRTEEPGGMGSQSMGSQSMGSQRVLHDCATNFHFLTRPCYYHIDTDYDCSRYYQFFTHFISAKVNKPQNAVLAQQGYIKLQLTMEYLLLILR